MRKNDPAIPEGLRGSLEVLLCTPGFQALLVHRLVHRLHVSLRVPVLPRLVSLVARLLDLKQVHSHSMRGIFRNLRHELNL